MMPQGQGTGGAGALPRQSAVSGEQQMNQTGAEISPSFGQRVRPWLIGGSISAFSISLAIHILFLIIAAAWKLGGGDAGGSTGREAGGEVGVAIMTETELGALQDAAMEAASPAQAVADSDASVSLPELTSEIGGSGESDVPVGDIGGISEGLGGAGGDIGDETGFGEVGGGAGGGAAKFFGLEASGTRFAYVIDVSGSMQGAKLSALKIEIIESTDALLEHMQFFVSPYSSDAFLLDKKNKWTSSSDNGKKWARDEIKDLEAMGGTNPVPSFQAVFDLKPRPDAIYFMTDGLFAEDVPHLIMQMNKRGRKVPIHCIAFDIQDKAVERMMKQIADESGGRYTSVPLTRNGR